jgi:uncharacterized protein
MIASNETPKPAEPASERTRLKKYHWLAKYDRDTINSIIDARIDYIYWHGSSAGRMLKTHQDGIPVCFTVTHLDGIVFSRAAFHHTVKFRSVMAFGKAEFCEDKVKRHAHQSGGPKRCR